MYVDILPIFKIVWISAFGQYGAPTYSSNVLNSTNARAVLQSICLLYCVCRLSMLISHLSVMLSLFQQQYGYLYFTSQKNRHQSLEREATSV